MEYTGERAPTPKNQSLSLKNRKELSVSGVSDVLAFDERTVTLKTVLGTLEVQGTALRIRNFDAAGGELLLDGSVSALLYPDGEEKKRGFFRR